MYGQSAHLLVRDAALEDSGSYRWSIFRTQAVARTNVIVTGTRNKHVYRNWVQQIHFPHSQGYRKYGLSYTHKNAFILFTQNKIHGCSSLRWSTIHQYCYNVHTHHIKILSYLQKPLSVWFLTPWWLARK